MIQAGIDEGARVLVGGPGKPEGFSTGWFVRPTIFCDVQNNMRVAQEEVFGPVLVIIPFEDENEAERLVNDTPYGLATYLQRVMRTEPIELRPVYASAPSISMEACTTMVHHSVGISSQAAVARAGFEVLRIIRK